MVRLGSSVELGCKMRRSRNLTEKGYSATGIEEVLRSVDVPKGSFYRYFPSKEQREES